jgi:zinc protease
MIRRLALLLAAAALASPAVETVTLPGESPLVSFRILFKTGAAHDPKGKEGLAQLTASMLAGGGSKAQTYDQIVGTFFPMAASFSAQVDKEMTVFSGTTHVENLDKYYPTIRQMLLEPGWREDDFRRIKQDQLNALRIGLRSNNEEELGKEFLYQTIYADHPYGHPNLGLGKSIESITLEDVRGFYGDLYDQGNLVIGLAGGYPQGFAEKVAKDFEVLGKSEHLPVTYTPPAPAKKLRVHILQKDTRSTLISIGFPLGVTRSDPDWPALKVMQSYFGQHRSSKSHLFQQIREIRGMNYGDYAYIEYFPRGMFQFQPDPNLARRQQIFQIWIRPVIPQNGVFALRIALYELNKLVEQGLSEEDFQSTKEFLSKFVNLLTQTANDELGYELDSKYYGIGDFNSWFKGKLNGLTRDAVNEAIKKHLHSSDLDIVVITKDAEAFRRALQSGAASKPVYASPPPKDVLDEDKLIIPYKLDLGEVQIVPADQAFE